MIDSIDEIHNKIVYSWRNGNEETLYNIIDITDGKVTVRNSIIETTCDPNGSEDSLRKFLKLYVRCTNIFHITES